MFKLFFPIHNSVKIAALNGLVFANFYVILIPTLLRMTPIKLLVRRSIVVVEEVAVEIVKVVVAVVVAAIVTVVHRIVIRIILSIKLLSLCARYCASL